MNLALSAIAREEPVVAQRSSVLLFGDPDAFSRLLFEALQLSRSNGQVCEDLQSRHASSFRRVIQRPNPIVEIPACHAVPGSRDADRVHMARQRNCGTNVVGLAV
jgi:hypothetical protein